MRYAILAVLMPAALMVKAVQTDSDSTLWLDDVTVTAIKQTTNLSLQPLASTVLNAGDIEAWNVKAVKNISEIAPNFYAPDYGSRMTSSIYVRGIGARMEQPVVGLNVDNVPLLNKDNYDFDMADIKKVEVLRGPQGTLYGRNTMGGQINIYTLQPMDYQGSRVAATLSNGPEARLAVSHYTKLRSNLAMGFAGNFVFSDGFYKNHYNARKVGTEKGGSLRWKTQWHATDNLAIDNVAAFSLTRQGGYPYEYAGSGRINYNDTCFYRRNSFSDGLTVKWNAGNFSLSSITSVQYLDDNMTLDQDFLPVDYFTLTQARHEWAVTQDLVARGATSSYSWLAGLFGFYKHTSMHAPVTIKEDGISGLITDRINNNDKIPVRLEWNEPSILLGSDFKIPVWGVALYHQSTLDLGRWNFALGLRLDYEKTALRYNSLCNTSYSVYMKKGMPPGALMSPEINIDETGRLSDDFVEFVPKLTVSYDLPMQSGSSIYASIGEGYKSGGYNTQMFSEVLQQRMMSEMMSAMPPGIMGGAPTGPDANVNDIISYRPEKSWNYELGAHIGCADGRVMTDLALFYIDCRDQQITTFPEGSTTGRMTTNAGRARSFGAEVQISYRPTSQWDFALSYGYTNAKFVRFVDGNDDFKGNYVPYAPSHTLSARVGYTHRITDNWHMDYNMDVRGVGRIYWNEANTVSQPFYAQLGASVVARNSWVSIEGWIENATGTKFDVFYFESIGNRFLQRGKPRRFGVTLRMEFDASASR